MTEEKKLDIGGLIGCGAIVVVVLFAAIYKIGYPWTCGQAQADFDAAQRHVQELASRQDWDSYRIALLDQGKAESHRDAKCNPRD